MEGKIKIIIIIIIILVTSIESIPIVQFLTLFSFGLDMLSYVYPVM
jgi:hypothetical protein